MKPLSVEDIQPLNDCVLVEPIKERTVKVAGTNKEIILPDAYTEKPLKGRLLAMGPGKLYQGEYLPATRKRGTVDTYTKSAPRQCPLHPQLKVGDIVLHGRYAGNEVTVNTKDGEKRVIIMRETDLLGYQSPSD